MKKKLEKRIQTQEVKVKRTRIKNILPVLNAQFDATYSQ